MNRFDDSDLPGMDGVGGLAEKFSHGNDFKLNKEADCANNSVGLLNANWDKENFINFILQSINMEKYCSLFSQCRISLDTFFNLNDSDLIAIGITDDKDRKIIIENVESHRKDPDRYIIRESHEEDLVIAKNILDHVALIQKYAAFLEYKWAKEKWKDHEGDSLHPPGKCLQTLVQRSLVQCNNISNLIFGQSNSQHIIGSVLKIHGLPMPKYLVKKLNSMKRKKRTRIWVTAARTMLGLTLLTILTVKYLA